MMISEPNINPGFTLKSFASTSIILFGFTSGFRILMITIMIMINTK